MSVLVDYNSMLSHYITVTKCVSNCVCVHNCMPIIYMDFEKDDSRGSF